MNTTHPNAQNAPPGSPTRLIDWSVLTRIGLTVALGFTLVVAIRWAMNVTNANARQVSTNLTHIQDGFGQSSASRQRDGHVKSVEAAPGPVLEPAD